MRYKNRSGNSGVVAYETGEDSISVTFVDGKVYVYNYAVTGKDEVETMKRLAQAGRGLSTYISTVVRTRYAQKRTA
ncbi:hypothetical protein QJS83_05540 [Bdellovibrio sp. 22V]|uniref:hypothetical protein n=1 Tax=Bdellovibrio TaxID=958 RepID=UPI00254361E6|nr:hypothetical protein [Bdellovibrio sp. 22V]WII73331.1 hypothetical protein QJS83_05540 [Bdellovibrio sp. 22V]